MAVRPASAAKSAGHMPGARRLKDSDQRIEHPDMGRAPIIAVDVKARFERPQNGRRLATGRSAVRPPDLGETLTRVLLLGSENTAEAARRHADLLMKPRAEGVGLLEFHQLDTAR
jgi:predicted acylesterase/phospholipase RssA